MKKQKGFSLIELMIVVAVIGVLAAVAMPQYQKYVAKSQAASALATIAALKTNVETEVAETTIFPSLASTSAGDISLGVPKTTLGEVALTPKSEKSADGAILFAFTNASNLLGAANIQLKRDVNGNWDCHTTVASTSFDLVPSQCRKAP